MPLFFRSRATVDHTFVRWLWASINTEVKQQSFPLWREAEGHDLPIADLLRLSNHFLRFLFFIVAVFFEPILARYFHRRSITLKPLR